MDTRVDTTERRVRLLAKARAEALVAVRESETRWLVSSGSVAGTGYAVGVVGGRALSCTCAAGSGGDALCKHRMLVDDALGIMAAPEAADLARLAAELRTAYSQLNYVVNWAGGKLDAAETDSINRARAKVAEVGAALAAFGA